MSKPNYFLVGTMYDAKYEQLGEWVKKSIWKLGWERKEDEQAYLNMKKIWDDFNTGDILFAKNMVVRKGYSGVKVKGIAKVISKESDGHTINVEWLTILDKTDYVEFKVPSSVTISRLKGERGLEIFEEIMRLNSKKIGDRK
ncbi:hypothetical protein LHT10_10125 [Lactococcus lactis]|uniref:hypothetical protein n=1 Tax=Lactococcus lactis TaxID=1358 RepID=UPI001F431BF2|nr:hypothetical protein [Lactococcus lactis]MCG1001492.1 hypothetical protein [Lactococcus lactis]